MPNATTLDLGEAIAAELRRMIVRCTSCTTLVMCEPCFTADRLLARYDEAEAAATRRNARLDYA